MSVAIWLASALWRPEFSRSKEDAVSTVEPPVQPTLGASVLVLNRHFLAVHVVGIRRALGLLYRGHAEVIQPEGGYYATYDFESWVTISELRAESPGEHDDWIRSVRFHLLLPRIIRLARYDRLPRQTLRFNRRNLFARDNHSCQYCGQAFPNHELSIDHVVPRSRGGTTSWENVVCSCLDCNSRKGSRTPQEARMTLLREPRRPSHHPVLAGKLKNPKYASWRIFLPHANWASDGG